MGKPDVVTARTPFGDLEARIGLVPIESLLAERDTLVQQVAELRARHGAFGTYDALRKVQLATIAAKLRAQALATGTKVTEASLDEAAHASPEYADFITQMTEEKAAWAIQENRITSISDTIQRGNVIGRFLASELGLSR